MANKLWAFNLMYLFRGYTKHFVYYDTYITHLYEKIKNCFKIIFNPFETILY
jgi:hypothetical protein